MFFDLDDYIIGFAGISEINREDKSSWEVTMLSGATYTIDGSNLKPFQAAFKAYRSRA